MKKTQKKLYPLKFVPVHSEHPWGSEDWNVVSLGPVSSTVKDGYLADNTLDDILETYLGDLVGDTVFDYYNLYFPVIIKVAHIQGRTSLQVHPSDEVGFERYDQFGKTKVWYVVDVAPDAVIYMGFNRKVSAEEFYLKCKDGSVVELLNAIRPRKGDCFVVEPGCIHASSGVVLAEVQQASELSFRLYDWGRENDPETARPMDLEEAIDIIDYEPYNGVNFKRGLKGFSNLLSDNHFIVNSIDVDKQYQVNMSKFDSFILYHCISGSFGIVTDEGFECTVECGESILIPASLSDFVINPSSSQTKVLEISIPSPAEEEDNYLNK